MSPQSFSGGLPWLSQSHWPCAWAGNNLGESADRQIKVRNEEKWRDGRHPSRVVLERDEESDRVKLPLRSEWLTLATFLLTPVMLFT